LLPSQEGHVADASNTSTTNTGIQSGPNRTSAPSQKPKLVVIGNGMAPGRALEKLFDAAPGRYDVTIFNAEPRVNYDRIMLSPLLTGEKNFEQIVIHGDGWYVKHNVTLYKGSTVTAIDRATKTVTSARGITVPYDKLIIATGSQPIVLPVPGHKLAGVLSYRDLDDVEAMLIAAKSRGNAVVIGGGLLGLEAAVGLQRAGHGRYRPPPHADLDGAPVRSNGRAPAAKGHRSAWYQGYYQGQHEGNSRRKARRSPGAGGRHAFAR
jgi:Pyridine nucleotide-disulphide oxidoreductase